MKPTFIGIGAQKCASTWSHRMLEAHPQVCVSQKKEIDYFSYHYNQGHQWYEGHFTNCSHSSMAVGETSPSYFCESAVPKRVYQYSPDARIIVSLRDPVERALSNHRHEVRTGHITGSDISFEAGLANNPMYIEQGRYATHLENWLKYFPLEQFLVVLMEDIKTAPLSVVENVYEFVGVDQNFNPLELSNHFNVSHVSRFRALLGVKDSLYDLTRTTGFGWIWSFWSSLGLRKMYRVINKQQSGVVIPEPNPKTLLELREIYRPEVNRLSELIQRPLHTWL